MDAVCGVSLRIKQIEMMREMGVTVLCSTSLPGTIRMHRTMPDVM